jgi:hypothetical protein
MLQAAALERDIEFQKARVQRLQGQIIASHEFTQQSDQSINAQVLHIFSCCPVSPYFLACLGASVFACSKILGAGMRLGFELAVNGEDWRLGVLIWGIGPVEELKI